MDRLIEKVLRKTDYELYLEREMPFYDFVCNDCGHNHKCLNQHWVTECDECDGTSMTQIKSTERL